MTVRECQFSQSLLFVGEVPLHVPMGGFNALMSKPQFDGGEIDAGLEQVMAVACRLCPERRADEFGQFVIENRNQQWIVLSQAASQKQSLGLIYSGETSMALMRG